MPKLSKNPYYRMLEIIPGFLVWFTFLIAIIFSFLKPFWVIYAIILFDLYWLIRVIYMLIHMLISWSMFREAVKIKWLEKTKEIPGWENIYHLIFFPTSKEGIEIVRPTFSNLAKMNYPKDKFIVVLAGEEKDKDNFLAIAEKIKEEFSDKFFKILVTLHPQNLEGEIPGKGSNTNWAGKRAKEFIDELKIPYEKIIVSSFDIDTCPHIEYFSYLTYQYLTNPDPTHTSYQPVALFNNNIWDSPALTRIVSRSTSFWLLTDLNRPERLYTFSSHSMSFKALVDVGFWQNDIVTEDSRIFLQCFIHYLGNYRVMPMYIPVSMDTVYSGNLWRSLVNQYKQQRRWAYGVENFPFLAWNLWQNKKLPRLKGFRYLWNQLEGCYSWASVPILIFLLGRLPLWLAGPEVKSTVLASNTPFVLEILMYISMIGLIFSAFLSTALLPPKPSKYKTYHYFFMVFQWVLFPVCFIIFGSLPAIESQTRLMLGKYLGFWVTEKKRKD